MMKKNIDVKWNFRNGAGIVELTLDSVESVGLHDYLIINSASDVLLRTGAITNVLSKNGARKAAVFLAAEN